MIKDWDIHYSADGEGTNLITNKLQYSYSVSGKEYLSNRVAFGYPWIMDSLFVGNTIEKALEAAPELKIYYNPNSPSESTLTCRNENLPYLQDFYIRDYSCLFMW